MNNLYVVQSDLINGSLALKAGCHTEVLEVLRGGTGIIFVLMNYSRPLICRGGFVTVGLIQK